MRDPAATFEGASTVRALALVPLIVCLFAGAWAGWLHVTDIDVSEDLRAQTGSRCTDRVPPSPRLTSTTSSNAGRDRPQTRSVRRLAPSARTPSIPGATSPWLQERSRSSSGSAARSHGLVPATLPGASSEATENQAGCSAPTTHMA